LPQVIHFAGVRGFGEAQAFAELLSVIALDNLDQVRDRARAAGNESCAG